MDVRLTSASVSHCRFTAARLLKTQVVQYMAKEPGSSNGKQYRLSLPGLPGLATFPGCLLGCWASMPKFFE